MYLIQPSVIAQLQFYFATVDPAYLEFFKIFAGCTSWIGGLILYMWWKEKNKPHETSLLALSNNH
ncbi:MAG: hypothetical protein JST58_06020 [Bacteroidetes bacterium]|nr:hypothetical protein [Bacteroidota bacterium]